jgi:nucleoside recognition membrane protein YjiH
VYLILLTAFLAGISAFLVGAKGLKDYTHITYSAEKVTIKEIIKISAFLGMASMLGFFALILSVSIVDETYAWNFQKLVSAISVSLFLGLIVTLGGLYQVYTTVKFRDLLIKRYNPKSKEN